MPSETGLQKRKVSRVIFPSKGETFPGRGSLPLSAQQVTFDLWRLTDGAAFLAFLGLLLV